MATAFSIGRHIPPAHRNAAAMLYWEAFSGKLGRIMRPSDKAIAFLNRVMDPHYAFSAVSEDGVLLGVAGFKTHNGAFIPGGLKDLAVSYGWPGAVWRGLCLTLLERKCEPEMLLMDGIFVAESARGLGIGSALLDQICEEARQMGCKDARLDVIDTNPRARALYERRGFTPKATLRLGPFRHLFRFNHATAMVKRLEHENA